MVCSGDVCFVRASWGENQTRLGVWLDAGRSGDWLNSSEGKWSGVVDRNQLHSRPAPTLVAMDLVVCARLPC